MSQEIDKPSSDSLKSGNGFVAPRYRSGQRSADALLEAGRALLADISYEALSINDLCGQANLTKGAFYRRFDSKDAFFLALQRLALDDADRVKAMLVARLDPQADATLTLHACAREVVDAMRKWHLRHRGVLRASIQRRDHTTDGWHPFKQMGRGFVDEVAARMTRLPELKRNKQSLMQLRIAFQAVVATMINAALNDPGPLHLDDSEMTDALSQMLASYAGGQSEATR